MSAADDYPNLVGGPEGNRAIAEIDYLRRATDYLTHSLQGLLDHAEDHHLSIPAHGHDCYELWKVEQEYARNTLNDFGAAYKENHK